MIASCLLLCALVPTSFSLTYADFINVTFPLTSRIRMAFSPGDNTVVTIIHKNSQACVSKVLFNGTISWETCWNLPAGNTDEGQIAVDHKTSEIVVTSHHSCPFSLTTSTLTSSAIRKYASNSTFIWGRLFLPSKAQLFPFCFFNIDVDQVTGDIYPVGNFLGNTTSWAIPQPVCAIRSTFLLKVNRNGVPQWLRLAPSQGGFDYGRSVYVDSAHGYI